MSVETMEKLGNALIVQSTSCSNRLLDRALRATRKGALPASSSVVLLRRFSSRNDGDFTTKKLLSALRYQPGGRKKEQAPSEEEA